MSQGLPTTDKVKVHDYAGNGIPSVNVTGGEDMADKQGLVVATVGQGGWTKVVGDVDHDSADTGAPIKIGGKARSSAPSDVANGDRVDAYFDLKGRLQVGTGGLTDTELRATPVPVSGTVTTGGLTDTQLRATAVPVSGPLTDTQLRATAVPVSGPLTDTQLRATPVPISGTITSSESSPGVDRTASGNVDNSPSYLAIDTAGCATVSVLLSTNALTGTISFYGVMGDGSLVTVYGYLAANTPVSSIACTSDTQIRRYLISCGGFTHVRVSVGSYTSGSVDVYMVASKAPNLSGLFDTATGALKSAVASVPADPFGTNADSASASGSISAKLRQIATNGIPIMGTATVSGSVTADTELPAAAALADGASNPTTPTVGTAALLYNGSTWDRERGNTFITILASAVRNTTTYSADITNHNATHLILHWDLTVGGGNIKMRIQAKDELSGVYEYYHADWGNISTAQTVTFVLGPGASTTSGDVNQVTAYPLPRTFRIEMVHASGTSLTYSVSAHLIRG